MSRPRRQHQGVNITAGQHPHSREVGGSCRARRTAIVLRAVQLAIQLGPDGRLTGRFGTNVLDDLIGGIDEFRGAATARMSHRMLGPAMLGAFAWLDDLQLLKRISEYPYACVAFTKQPRPFPVGQACPAPESAGPLPRLAEPN